jgi:hypothetical protein
MSATRVNPGTASPAPQLSVRFRSAHGKLTPPAAPALTRLPAGNPFLTSTTGPSLLLISPSPRPMPRGPRTRRSELGAASSPRPTRRVPLTYPPRALTQVSSRRGSGHRPGPARGPTVPSPPPRTLPRWPASAISSRHLRSCPLSPHPPSSRHLSSVHCPHAADHRLVPQRRSGPARLSQPCRLTASVRAGRALASARPAAPGRAVPAAGLVRGHCRRPCRNPGRDRALAPGHRCRWMTTR